MELFKQAAGVNLTHIPYKGTSGVMNDLIGNHVSAMFIPTHVAMPFMRATRSACSASPAANACPRWRTSRRCRSRDWRGRERPLVRLLAPAGTPPEVVARFNTAMNEIIRTQDMVASLAKQGLVVSGGGPEVLRDLIVKDRVKWAKVIADAGIKAE